MNSPFAQALFVALVAGIAAALMSGFVLTPSPPALMLTMLAPLPLMLAGFGWHPLTAALGGILAILLAQAFNSTQAGLMVAGVLAVPSFGITALSLARFGQLAQRPQRDGRELGGIGVLLMLFLALVGVLAAMAVEPDFEAMTQRLRAALEIAMREAVGIEVSTPAARGGAMARLYDILAGIILPMSALVTLSTLIISAALGAQLAERAGVLPFSRPDYRRFAVPGGGLVLLGLAFLVATRAGYLGVLGDTVTAGMLFLFMVQGLAVIHVRSLGFPGRGILLFLVWACLIVFGLPAFIFMLVGILDHLLDLRRGHR